MLLLLSQLTHTRQKSLNCNFRFWGYIDGGPLAFCVTHALGLLPSDKQGRYMSIYHAHTIDACALDGVNNVMSKWTNE